MSAVSAFDWSAAVATQRPVRIRTALGNTIVGRVKGYVIWRPAPHLVAHDEVHIKGIASHRPGLTDYRCNPWSVSAL